MSNHCAWLVIATLMLLSQGCASESDPHCRPGVSKEACIAELQAARSRIMVYWDSWIKDGGGESERQTVWLACGGSKNGEWNIRRERLADFIKPGEDSNSYAVHTRALDEFQRCLVRGGLRWTGVCTEYQKHWRPACGAP